MTSYSSAGTSLRCFIALDLLETAQNQLTIIQNQLKLADGRARWIPSQNLHITLRFLGNHPPKRLEQISNTLTDLFYQAHAFTIVIDALDAFPDSKEPRVIWAGVSDENNQLQSIFQHLNNGLARLGLPKDRDKFIPHITLARCRNAAEITSTAQAIKKVPIKPIRTLISRMTFYQSTLNTLGVSYTPIRSILFPS